MPNLKNAQGQLLPERPVPGRHVLLFYQDMSLYGGIETLVIRIARKEMASHSKVSIVVDPKKVMPEISDIPAINIFEITKNIARFPIGEDLDVIAFGPNPAALAFEFCWAASTRGIKVRFATGVYHPRDFQRENERRHLHVLNYFLARSIGPKNIFFMNDECRRSHSQLLGLSFGDSKVIPIPMGQRPLAWVPRDNKKTLRIICVGRIVPFKAYNFSLPGIVRSVIESGVDVVCHVYGHGTHEEELLHAIEQNSVGANVSFLGVLPFEKFDAVVLEYDLFIGMGTSAVQAAQVGIPTLLAIDNNPTECYGYLCEAPFGNVGEASDSIPKRPIRDSIISHTNKSEIELIEISNECVKSASAYEGNDYIKDALEGGEFLLGVRNFFGIIYAKIHRLLSERNALTMAMSFFLRRAGEPH